MRNTTAARRLAARVVGMVTVVLVAITVTSGEAWAAYCDNLYPTGNTQGGCHNESGPNGSVTCRTDNGDVYFYMDSHDTFKLETVDRNKVFETWSKDYRPTVLTGTYDSTPTFSGGGETDIIYQEGSSGVPDSADGVTWCNDAVDRDSVRCDQQFIRIRGNGRYTRGLTCHETGHAIGLVHGSVASPRRSNSDYRLGCMRTPVGANQALGANNRDNINGFPWR